MEPSPPPFQSSSRTLTDLDEDSLAHCATFLDRGDVLSLALTCRHLRRVAYSDSVWSHLFRKHWPYLSMNPGARVREAYLERHASLQQFKFIDPVEIDSPVVGVPPSHIMLNRDDIILAQGSCIQALKIDISRLNLNASETYRAHSARITSMRTNSLGGRLVADMRKGVCIARSRLHLLLFVRARLLLVLVQLLSGIIVLGTLHWTSFDTSSLEYRLLLRFRAMHFSWENITELFPVSYTSLCRRDTHSQDMVLVTSSADHTIRLWWKGRSLRSFKGHNSPVTTLGDRLLGSSNLKVLASGGEDGTIRLWSFSSSGKRNPLSTFYGHEKQISSLSVAGHNPSLLVSISKDAKIRVWDTAVTSATRSGPCVGMTSVSGQPLDMKCHEALCYVGAGSSVTAIDLRTMQKAFSTTIYPEKLYAFEVLPSKSLLCTGGPAKAMLWDIHFQRETEPIANLEGHEGNVTMIHMDPYKIVTGGLHDPSMNVWETNVGMLTNNLPCLPLDAEDDNVGLTGMAVDGQRIVTASWGRSSGLIQFRDFYHASTPKPSGECQSSSKFWEGFSEE